MEVRVENTDLGEDSVGSRCREKDPAHGYWKQRAVTRCREGHMGGGKNRQTDRQTASRRSSEKRMQEGRGQGTPGSRQTGAALRTSETFWAAFLKTKTQTVTMQYSELEGTLGLTQSTCSFQAEDTQAQKVTLVF